MLKPNKTRAKIILIFFALALVIDIAFIVSGFLQLNLLKSVESGVMISTAEASSNDIRHMAIAGLAFVVSIVCIVTFIMWFRRAYYNLHQRVSGLEFSEGWAAGAWFVPFLNLGRPVKIMWEMARETESLLVKEKLMEPTRILKILIPIWWTFWLLQGVVSSVARQWQKRISAESLQDLITNTQIEIIDTAAGIPALIAVFFMIRSYSRMEDLLPLVDTAAEQRPMLSDGDLLDR